MKICTKEEIITHAGFFDAVMQGAIVVYPTDTIYGIGCNALNNDAITQIRKLKDRTTPFSVIAPSKAWIRQHCIVPPKDEEWLDKLPGPYTLVLPVKNTSCVAPAAYGNAASNTLGVRMLQHWMQEIIAELGMPFITTSVNKSGKEPMTCLEDIDKFIRANVDIIIDDGQKQGNPSTVVHLDKENVQVVKR